MNDSYYLCGPDGSGKTTFITEIEKHLHYKNINTKHIWIRSPKIFSKPLMAYCRLVGLTKYKNIDGVKYGKHEFFKSKFVSYLFPLLQLIDFKIQWRFEKKEIELNEIVLFDRFSLDTLADLMVDTRRMDMHTTWIGKAFIKLIPRHTNTIVMNVNEKVIRTRKKDTLYDEHLGSKIEVYKILSRDLNIKRIDNNRTQDIVNQELLQELGLDERNQR